MKKVISFIKYTIVSIFFTKKNINENKIIFSSSGNVSFDYNSKYLFLYMLQNTNYECKYVINDYKKREKLISEYGNYFIETESLKGIIECLNSKIWFTSAGLPIYGFKLNKNRKIINLWHGIPIKKIALMEENINIFVKMYFKHIFSNNYTEIVSTSKNLEKIYCKSFGVKENKIKVLGQPRNDIIFNYVNSKNILEKISKEIPTYKNIILYAPTHRDGADLKIFPFEDFSEKNLHEFLEKHELLILIRKHKFDKAVKIPNSSRVLEISDLIVEDVMNILNMFDLLITDYSSIYLDYLLINKPVAFIPYDQKEYLNKRGMNFKYDDVTPGPKLKNFKQFKSEILKLLNDKTYYNCERKKVKAYFHDIESRSCEKIVKFINGELI